MRKFLGEFILTKSFCFHKRYYGFILLIALLSVISISSIENYLMLSKAFNIYENNSKYGVYEGGFYNIDESTMKQLICENQIENYHIYQEESLTKNNIQLTLYNSTQEIMNFINVELVEGKFPQNNTEILCEAWYLIQEGYILEQAIGQQIKIDDMEYIISGYVKTYNLYEGIHHTVCIANNIKKPNAILFQTSQSDLRKFISDMEKKYISLKGNGFINLNRELLNENTNSFMNYGLYIIIIILCVIFTTVVLNNCIMMILIKYKKVIGIYSSIGISSNLIKVILCNMINITILIGNFLGFVISTILFKYLQNFLYKDTIELDYSLNGIILGLIVLTIFEWLYVFFDIRKLIKNNIMDLILEKRTLKGKFELKGERCLLLKMARNNKYFSKEQNIISIICLGVSITIMVSLLYCVNNFNRLYSKSDFDYIIDFEAVSTLPYDYEEEQKDLYNMISLKISDYDYNPSFIYSSFTVFPKKLLTKELRKELSENIDYKTALRNTYQSDIRLPLIILGYSEKQLSELLKKEVKLGDWQCIALENVWNISGNNKKIRFDKEDQIAINDRKNKIIDVTINQIYNGEIKNLDYSGIGVVLIVNMNTFTQISNKIIPSKVYISLKDKKESEFINLFSGRKSVKLVNLAEDIKELKKLKKELATIFIVLVLILTAITLINTMITIYVRIKYFEEEYGIMHRLGISTNKRFRVILYELIFILFPSIFIGFILSIFCTYVIENKLPTQGLFSYEFPWYYFMCSILLLVLSVVVCSLPIYIAMKSLSYYKEET